jgi:hypothetical protein
MGSDIDPEDLSILLQMSEFHEQAVNFLLANDPESAFKRATQAIQVATGLKIRGGVPHLLKEKFAPLLYRLGTDLSRCGRLDDGVFAVVWSLTLRKT